MPVETKPIPKTVDQVANAQITPYDKLGYGNPNSTGNRGNDVSVRNDTVKDLNIDLIDLSTAVRDYIVNTIKPVVYENGSQIPVPVQFASPERWVAVQKEGFLRDKEGRILLPMIIIKRDSVVRNRALGNKLDGNKVNLYQSFSTRFNKRNVYDNFAVLTKRIPVKEFHIVPVPDYVIVTFNVSILTNAQDQADDLIQAFNFVADSYWGQPDRFRFKVNIESFTDTVEYNQGEDRSIRSNFNIVMNGYLLPESVARNLASQKKFLSKATIKFSMETTSSDLETFSVSGVDNPNKIPVTIIDSYIHQGTGGSSTLSPEILTYLQTDIELTSSTGSVFSNGANFSAGFLTAPVGFAPTSINNFIFFANGQYLNTGSLVSFVDNGNNTSTLTVNTASIGSGGLGYSLGSDWQITARGKFKE